MERKASSHTVVNRLSVGPVTHLRISGVIDETFNPQTFMKELAGHIILDLGRVERISSFGVRKWIEFSSELPAGTTGLYMVHAPPLVVDQLNMVEGFAGVAHVLSVLAPYLCNACGEDRLRLVDLQQEAAIIAEGKAPAHTCPVCQSSLQFADLPAEFFDYARHQQPRSLDPSVGRYLKMLQPAETADVSEVVAHVKLVQDDITYFRIANVLRGDLNVRRLAAGLEGRVVYDFGNVSSVEPAAGPRLLQILETASQGAQVSLWRVTPQVLAALAQGGQPLAGAISTLYLPCECRNCGSKGFQRFEATAYLAALTAGSPGERPCQFCNGKARVPALQELAPFLASTPLTTARAEEVEALEPRALSQYLAGAAAHDPAGESQKSELGASGSGMRLQILRRIGQGGMAEVFLARQVGLKGFEKYVVVKKILESFAQMPDFVEMLFAEARANARLTHQNIVQTFDVGITNGVAYITMEYVRGPDVKRLLTLMRKAGLPMPLPHALRIVTETAAGLHYAHSYVDPTGTPHPMVHRDVSPHNMLLSLDGAIKLSDFGIAKVHGEAENTRPGTFKGKIAYLPPEAIVGMTVDARSDVFALGVSLFEMLTGKLPFRRENEAATLQAIMREPAPRVTKLNPEVPEDLSALVVRALEKDPERRIRSAGEFREELEAVMARHQMNASPTAVAQYFLEKLGPQLAEFAPNAQAPAGSSRTGIPRPSGGNTQGSLADGARPRPPTRPSDAIPLRQTASEVSAERPAAQRPEVRAPPQVEAAEPAQEPPPPQPPLPPPPAAIRPPPPPQMRPRTQGAPVRVTPPPPPPALDGIADQAEPATVVAAPWPTKAGKPAPAPRPKVDANPEPPPPPRPSVAAEPELPASPWPQGPPQDLEAPEALEPEPEPGMEPEPEPQSEPQPELEPELPNLHGGGFVRRWIIGGVVLAVAVVAVVGVTMRGGRTRVEVTHLEPGEHLFISGMQVDPANLPSQGGRPLIVSTSREGRLHRLGTASLEGSMDMKALVEAHLEPGGGERASLSVRSEPVGCEVQVVGVKLPTPTPVQASVEAGKELQVEVTCPGYSWTQLVMAAPGQSLEVLARQSR